MKAKLYLLGTMMEVVVGNKVYASNEKESKEDFLKRLNAPKGPFETDFDEAVTVVDISTKSLEKMSDEVLTEGFMASKGALQEQILKGILEKRGIAVEKLEKTSRTKVETLDKETVQKSEAYLDAKSKVGMIAEYVPTGAVETEVDGEKIPAEVVRGEVKSISLNKTNTIIYFNIKQGSKLRCCTSKNETLKFHEI